MDTFWKIVDTTLYLKGVLSVEPTPSGYIKHTDADQTPAWINAPQFYYITDVVFEKSIYNTVSVRPVYMTGWFRGAKNLTKFNNIENLDLSTVTKMHYCFGECESLDDENLSVLDFTTATSLFDMGYCFYNCKSITISPEIPNSVTNMDECFYNCTSLKTAPDLSDLTSLYDMTSCFYNCASLTMAPEIPGSVTNMNRCFCNCELLISAPSIPSSVISMNRCFENCSSLTIAPDMSNASSVTDMTRCFYRCTSLTTAPKIPSSVTSLASCFYYCTSLMMMPEIETPSSIYTMAGCFDSCISLTTASNIPASVTNMVNCFNYCINLTGTIEINSTTLTSTDIFRDTAQLIVLKGTYPQLSTIADQYSNVYVYSLSDTITGERDDDILNLVTLSVQVNRFKAGSNDDVLSAINVYKNNNSSALLGLEWFTDDAADPQPDSTTWNQGEGWYLRNGNAPNYVFVEQNNKQLDTAKTYYKALESFIIDESPKIFYTNIDSVSEDEATTFNIIVTDAYGEAATQYLTIPIAFYTMDVVKGGRVISFGQHATQDMLYKLLESAPTDWLTDYNNYYQKDSFGNYIQLDETTAPSFETDTYYQLEYPNGLFNCRMGAKFIDMIVTNLVGEIKIYAGATVPNGWLECDGSELNVEDYPLLFGAIGNTYGGDGITTFYLPDLRGRFPIGMGLGTVSDATSRTLGQPGGSERVTLKVNQIPAHTHDYQKPVLMYGSGGNAAWPGAGSTSTGSDQWGYSGVTSTGGGESHGNMPPYLAIKYIICAA